jgi:organic hydroperoxide reductase OsmC/OhrA
VHSGELLAAAYSAFMATYVAQGLHADGAPARELVVNVWCRLSPLDRSPRAVEELTVEVRGRVDEIEDSEFGEAVRPAWDSCMGAVGSRDGLHTKLGFELA